MSTTTERQEITLELRRDLVERARQLADAQGITVSEMVSRYFASLVEGAEAPAEQDTGWKKKLRPITRSLIGVAAGSQLDEDDYREYLAEKHLHPRGSQES